MFLDRSEKFTRENFVRTFLAECQNWKVKKLNDITAARSFRSFTKETRMKRSALYGRNVSYY